MRIGPAARDQSAMPAQQRVRPHEEDVPAAPWQQPTHRGKQQPIVRLEARPTGLSAKNRELVTEHENLQLLLRSRRAKSTINSSSRPKTTYSADTSKGDLQQTGRQRYRAIIPLFASPDRVSAPHGFGTSPCRAVEEGQPPSLAQHRIQKDRLHRSLLQRSWHTIIRVAHQHAAPPRPPDPCAPAAASRRRRGSSCRPRTRSGGCRGK